MDNSVEMGRSIYVNPVERLTPARKAETRLRNRSAPNPNLNRRKIIIRVRTKNRIESVVAKTSELNTHMDILVYPIIYTLSIPYPRLFRRTTRPGTDEVWLGM